MIYLQRYSTGGDGSTSVEIAVVEDAEHVGRYEARGFSQCTPDEFRAAWRRRDQQALLQIWAALGVEQERAVGEPGGWRSQG
jgi:hypothetical protein